MTGSVLAGMVGYMDNQPDLADLKKILDQPTTGTGVPHRACLCGKLLDETEHTVRCHSGIVNFAECLCKDCRKEMKDYVRVVCLKCRSLMSLLKPVTAATGFRFLPNTCVHVESCQGCTEGKLAFPVLEHLKFCHERGMPTNADKDIVQEAEQKFLQGEREAGKVIAELQSTFPAS